MRKRLSKKVFIRAEKRKAVVGKPTEKTEMGSSKTEDSPPELPETDGWLLRNEVCDMLRISPQTIKHYEDRGILHPLHALRKDRSDVERVMLVYNPKELTKLRTRSGSGQPFVDAREPKEQSARAFELFRQGRTLDEIVIELREDPDRIDYLHERWLEQTKARYVISPEAKQVLEKRLGKFESVTELIELFERKLTPE